VLKRFAKFTFMSGFRLSGDYAGFETGFSKTGELRLLNNFRLEPTNGNFTFSYSFYGHI
jgi:hypothetical protein